MMDFQDLLVTQDRVEILGKMVRPDQQACLDRLVQLAIEDLRVHLVQEDFKVCLGLQENPENPVKMEKLDFLVSLE